MPAIGIDCRFASTPTGLGRYTRELVTHLLRRSDPVSYVLFVDEEHPPWIPADALPHRLVVTGARHYSFAEQWSFPRAIRRSGIDLLFAPHFNVPLLCPVPFVATIHDLILHRYPNQSPPLRRTAYRAVMRHAVVRSRSLIAVSDFTAREIAQTYGESMTEKTTVIHEAASPAFSRKSGAACAPVLKKYALQKPYFLYVGNAKQHKNVQMLIDAYASLGTTETELVLVTHGKEAERLRLIPGVRIVGAIDDHDLPCLYFFAACFVTASLYEGFGLPIVEAAACGCSIIAVARGAVPEVAPASALLVEPTVEALADALREPPPPSHVEEARTWDDAAQETFAVLSRILPS